MISSLPTMKMLQQLIADIQSSPSSSGKDELVKRIQSQLDDMNEKKTGT